MPDTNEHPFAAEYIKSQQRFKNFWSNVSSIQVAATVPDKTQERIIYAMQWVQRMKTGK